MFYKHRVLDECSPYYKYSYRHRMLLIQHWHLLQAGLLLAKHPA
ncbi:GSCOCG00010216001-RA-CDS [Cotesia congregata]|nr:GSCOCG00010216001-RA-CDS [Cotesia congregata]